MTSSSSPDTTSAQLRSKAAHFTETYGLAGYTINALAAMAAEVDFNDKNVLEFGGWNIPMEVTLETMGARSWTSVDMIGSVSGAYQSRRFKHLKDVKIVEYDEGATLLDHTGHLVINGDASKLPETYFDQFDIVVSFATLEHVLDMPSFLDKAYQALVKGGHFLTRYGPVWSSHIGHHAYVTSEINFQKPDGPIGRWNHLLLTPPEMYDHLRRQGVADDIAANAVFQIYTSSRVNRLFNEDYKAFFAASSFEETRFATAWSVDPPPGIQTALELAHPRYTDFSAGAWLTCSVRAD